MADKGEGPSSNNMQRSAVLYVATARLHVPEERLGRGSHGDGASPCLRRGLSPPRLIAVGRESIPPPMSAAFRPPTFKPRAHLETTATTCHHAASAYTSPVASSLRPSTGKTILVRAAPHPDTLGERESRRFAARFSIRSVSCPVMSYPRPPDPRDTSNGEASGESARLSLA